MARAWRFAAKPPFLRRADPAASPADDAGPIAAAEVSGDGVFFDGISAKPIPVPVRVAGGRLILGGPVWREWDCGDLRASETVRPFMRVGPSGSRERLELTDGALTVAIEAASPDLRPRDRIPYRLLGCVLGAAVALLGFALYGLPILVDLAMPAIPLSFEQRVATAARKQLDATLLAPGECAAPAGRAALERMVMSLKIAAGDPALALPPIPIDVRVVDSSVANAFALPGGTIVLTSQLIASANRSDELAGVIAHELGHVAARDPTRLMLQNLGRSLLLGFFMGDMTGSTIFVAMGNEVVSAQYGREAERAADAFAARTMLRAGADATALADFLERIDPDDDETLAFLSDHPFTSERAAAIRAGAAVPWRTQPILEDGAWTVLKAICPPERRSRVHIGPLPKR